MAKTEKPEKKPEKKQEDQKILQHVEGIKKTVMASLFGIVGGIISILLECSKLWYYSRGPHIDNSYLFAETSTTCYRD